MGRVDRMDQNVGYIGLESDGGGQYLPFSKLGICTSTSARRKQPLDLLEPVELLSRCFLHVDSNGQIEGDIKIAVTAFHKQFLDSFRSDRKDHYATIPTQRRYTFCSKHILFVSTKRRKSDINYF